MSENSKIEWTDHTFNPWWGCQKVSDGCKYCYAETLDNRYHHQNPHWGPGSDRKGFGLKHWMQPLKWNKDALAAGVPAKVFCASMADVFEDHIQTYGWEQQLWNVIESTPWLTWQLLTKRPENIMQVVPDRWQSGFPSNVWIGTSVENQKAADERIPHLLKVPAAVRFLSCEPLLGPLDLSGYIGPVHIDDLTKRCGYFEAFSPVNGGYGCAHPDQEEVENGKGKCYSFSCPIASRLEPYEPLDHPIYKAFGLNGDEEDYVLEESKVIHWVIAGGESGPHARPMHPDWARSLRDQCAAAGVPFFLKQWGEWSPVTYKEALFSDKGTFGHWGRKKETFWKSFIDDDEFPGSVNMQKTGKHVAGRLLDGVEHNEFPHPQQIKL